MSICIKNYNNYINEKISQQYKQHTTCNGCTALTVLTKEYIKNELCIRINDITIEEIHNNELFGECALGFKQKWETWGKAKPIEPCPKPETEADFLRCVSFFN